MLIFLFFLTIVGVSFSQPSYTVNEMNNRVQVGLILTSSLPTDATATITESPNSATSESLTIRMYVYVRMY